MLESSLTFGLLPSANSDKYDILSNKLFLENGTLYPYRELITQYASIFTLPFLVRVDSLACDCLWSGMPTSTRRRTICTVHHTWVLRQCGTSSSRETSMACICVRSHVGLNPLNAGMHRIRPPLCGSRCSEARR